MAVTLGVLNTTGAADSAANWTTVTPSGTPQVGNETPPASATDTWILCVSSSTGKDGGDAGYSAANGGKLATPFRSIDYARAVHAAGGRTGGKPDWILLLKGDTFIDQNFADPGFHDYGVSSSGVINPFVIACYDPSFTASQSSVTYPVADPYGSSLGSGAPTYGRALIQTPYNLSGISTDETLVKTHGNYLYVSGIEFYPPYRDPNNANFIQAAQAATFPGSPMANAIVQLPQSYQTGQYAIKPGIITSDAMSVKFSGGSLPTGISTSTTYYLFPITTTVTGTVVKDSNIITSLSSTAGLFVGQTITAAGAGGQFGVGQNAPRILSINTGASSCVISRNALAAGSGITITLGTQQFTISTTPTSVTNITTTSGGSGTATPLNTWRINGTSEGAACGTPFDWRVFENCKFTYYQQTQMFAATVPWSLVPLMSVTFYARRCIFRYHWVSGDSAFGAATGVDGGPSSDCHILESLVDHNGWIDDTITDPSKYGFGHNIYTHPVGTHSTPNDDRLDMEGCIISREAHNSTYSGGQGGSALRTGGTYKDNLWLDAGPIAVFSMPYNQTLVDRNCYLEGSAGFQTQPVWFDDFDLVNLNAFGALCTNNIIANHINPGGTAFNIQPGFDGININNNIVFNTGGTSSTATVGCIYSASVNTAGSSYTAKATTINGSAPADNAFPSGIKLSTTGTAPNMSRGQALKLSGTSSGLLNGYYFQSDSDAGDGTHIRILWPDAPSGSYPTTTTGTLDFCYNHFALSTLTGGGSGATGCFIVHGTAVDSVFFTGAGDVNESYGSGYAVGDTFNSTTLNTAAGGTGFVGIVTKIAVNVPVTDSGQNNKFDLTGTNTFSFPGYPATGTAANVKNVTSGTYYGTIVGGTPTMAQFLDACALQSKTNWNQSLTATNANIFIRTAFGISGGVTPPSVLMPQICM